MRSVLPLAIGAAAVAGIAVGSLTATPPRVPEPSVAVAELPTSTPDIRPTLRPQTLTPTQAPAPEVTAAATFPTIIQITAPPNIAPSPIPTPRPAPSAEPRGRPVVFFAASGKEPAPVQMPTTVGGSSESDHVFFRISALRQQKGGPEGYANIAGAMRAQLAETTVETPGTVVIGFLVPSSGDWGVSADQVKLLLQQLVFTATEEPTIDRVLITQNGGKPAVIAGQVVDKALGRAEVR